MILQPESISPAAATAALTLPIPQFTANTVVLSMEKVSVLRPNKRPSAKLFFLIYSSKGANSSISATITPILKLFFIFNSYLCTAGITVNGRFFNIGTAISANTLVFGIENFVLQFLYFFIFFFYCCN